MKCILENLLGYAVTAYYPYENIGAIWYQKERGHSKPHAFFNEIDSIAELKVINGFLRSASGMCQEYSIKNDYCLHYYPEKKQFDFQTSFLLEKVQREALQFVEDFVAVFPTEWEEMPYCHLERPFYCLIKKSTDFDHGIFLAADFNDTESSSKNDGLYYCWNQCCIENGQLNPCRTLPIGLKGALIIYVKKHCPRVLRPLAVAIKKLLRW